MSRPDVDVRNERARSIVTEYIQIATDEPLTNSERRSLAKELIILDRLIPVKANGFRGVVLTSIVGLTLDHTYKPSENFYRCNPRSIFEQGIYYALVAANIPCGKSDPLNVAKNIQKLDYDWAQAKRPEDAAKAAVDYLKIIEAGWPNEQRRAILIRAFFSRLIEYAKTVNKQITPLQPQSGDVPAATANRLVAFALECPEGGAIPQFIVGNLIRLLRSGDSSYSSVEGVDESVFGTNTTSKKPADIWEIRSDGSIGELFEITVKKIDFKRLDDCVDAFRRFDSPIRTITFICNMPDDVKPLTTSLCRDGNTMLHGGIRFQFLDIRSFIIDTFCLLDARRQAELLTMLHLFVSATVRGIRTKEYWSSVFSLTSVEL